MIAESAGFSRGEYVKKADSAPDGALFSVTKVENGETKTYYGTEDADFSTDNLSEATAIELLGDLTVKTAFSTSATISINKDIIFKLTKTLTYEGTGTAIKVNAGKLTLSGSSTIIKSIQDDVTIIEIAENAELKVQKSISTATISNSDKSNCIGIKSSGKVTIGDSAEIHLGGSGSVGVESNGELIVSGTSCKINGKKYGVNITGGTLTASKGTIQNSATDSEASIKISNKNVTATISGVTVGNSSSKAANALVIANDSKSGEVSKVYIAGNSTFHSSGDAILNNDSSVKIAASATDSNVYSINIDGYTRFYDSADKMNTAINGAQAYITTDTIADEDSLDPTKTDPTKTKYYTKLDNANKIALANDEKLYLTTKGKNAAVAYIERDGKKTYYTSRSGAFKGTTDGDTVVLCNNVTTSTTFINKWEITLDLAGYTICPIGTSMSGYALRVDAPATTEESKGHLIIEDSVGGGTIGGANYGYGIYVTGYQKKILPEIISTMFPPG